MHKIFDIVSLKGILCSVQPSWHYSASNCLFKSVIVYICEGMCILCLTKFFFQVSATIGGLVSASCITYSPENTTLFVICCGRIILSGKTRNCMTQPGT